MKLICNIRHHISSNTVPVDQPDSLVTQLNSHVYEPDSHVYEPDSLRTDL